MMKNIVSLNGSWIHAMLPNYVGLYVILLNLKHTWPSGEIEATCRLTHLNTHYLAVVLCIISASVSIKRALFSSMNQWCSYLLCKAQGPPAVTGAPGSEWNLSTECN